MSRERTFTWPDPQVLAQAAATTDDAATGGLPGERGLNHPAPVDDQTSARSCSAHAA